MTVEERRGGQQLPVPQTERAQRPEDSSVTTEDTGVSVSKGGGLERDGHLALRVIAPAPLTAAQPKERQDSPPHQLDDQNESSSASEHDLQQHAAAIRIDIGKRGTLTHDKTPDKKETDNHDAFHIGTPGDAGVWSIRK
jgi:hypothetical protein